MRSETYLYCGCCCTHYTVPAKRCLPSTVSGWPR